MQYRTVVIAGPRTTITIALSNMEGAHEFLLVDDFSANHGQWLKTNEFSSIGEGKLIAPGLLARSLYLSPSYFCGCGRLTRASVPQGTCGRLRTMLAMRNYSTTGFPTHTNCDTQAEWYLRTCIHVASIVNDCIMLISLSFSLSGTGA